MHSHLIVIVIVTDVTADDIVIHQEMNRPVDAQAKTQQIAGLRDSALVRRMTL